MAGLAFLFALIVYAWSFVRPATPAAAPNGKPVIAASFYPLAFLAREIAGSGYDVTSVTPGGVEPHDFEPSPQDIVRLQSANILFANGLGLDPWVERLHATLKERGVAVVTVSDGIEEKGVPLIAGGEEDIEEAGHANPHVWLDPLAMQTLAASVSSALSQAFPADKELFAANAQKLNVALAALDQSYKTGLASCRLHEVIVSHDAFAYLARRYGFSVIAIAGFSPQEQPSAKHLGDLVTLAKQKGIKTVFFETLVSPKLSETLAAEVGATTAVLNPIEGFSETDLSAGKTYVTAMESNLNALRLAMECQ